MYLPQSNYLRNDTSMPKRNGSVFYPELVGPGDDRLDLSTENLSKNVTKHFKFMTKKQKKIQTHLHTMSTLHAQQGSLIDTLMKNQELLMSMLKGNIGAKEKILAEMTKQKDDNLQTQKDTETKFQKLMATTKNLARQTNTRATQLQTTLAVRNDLFVERIDKIKSSVVREIVQTPRVNFTWYGAGIVTTPYEAQVAEQQLLLTDDNPNFLSELEQALEGT